MINVKEIASGPLCRILQRSYEQHNYKSCQLYVGFVCAYDSKGNRRTLHLPNFNYHEPGGYDTVQHSPIDKEAQRCRRVVESQKGD